MNVLGIETSCDETACSVVRNGNVVRSNIISSSLALHARHGGIIPEIAFRAQLETITPVAEQALSQGKVRLDDIGLLAVTKGPGLLGSLLVGVSFAKAVALSRKIPLIGVNHLHAHMYSPFLTARRELPFISLVISGGHTSLYKVPASGEPALLGETLDDACGEAFDKVAKILGLGFPGGPAIEKAALSGDPEAIRFPRSNTRNEFDFSFSGIKTAVLYYWQKHGRKHTSRKHGKKTVADICASFQRAAFQPVIDKALAACARSRIRALAVGGGVAANGDLRSRLTVSAKKFGIQTLFPEKKYCTDNAAMVAGLAFHLFKEGMRSDLKLGTDLDERS